jgi:hypothetical protein
MKLLKIEIKTKVIMIRCQNQDINNNNKINHHQEKTAKIWTVATIDRNNEVMMIEQVIANKMMRKNQNQERLVYLLITYVVSIPIDLPSFHSLYLLFITLT